VSTFWESPAMLGGRSPMPFYRLVYLESSTNRTRLVERHGVGAYALSAIRRVLMFRGLLIGSSCRLVVEVPPKSVGHCPSHR